MKKQLLLSTKHSYRYITTLIVMLLLSVSARAIPPVITSQPTNEAICASANAYFGVNASYTTSYQWQVSTGGAYTNVVDGGVYTGATTNGLQVNGAPTSMNGYTYRCICTGPDAPAATSNVATLTVYTPASISVNPAVNTTICSGDNTSYTVTAAGSNLTYVWYGHNGVTYVPLTNTGFYSGVTTSTLNITGITTGTTASTYSYYCIVSGPCNNVSTPTLYLDVNSRPAITAQPVNKTVCVGNNATFEVSATGTGLTYQWEVSYGGAIWTPLTNSGGYANVTTSLMTVTTTVPMHGSRYRCVVSGACTPAATSTDALLSLNNTLSITGNPTDKTICPNASTSFVVAATGTALTYQWQVNSGGGWSNLSNSGIYSDVNTTNLKLTGATAIYNNYKYRCIVNGACSLPTTSGEATLTFYDPVVVTSNPPALSAVCDGDNFSYTVGATGSGLSYQWFVYNGSTYVAMTNGGFYSGVTTPTLTITGITTGASTTTYSYFCVVSGTCNNAGSNTLYLDVNALPALTSQPQNDTTCLGNDAFFQVTATGTNLTYQWQVSYNGTNWANLTNTGGYANVTTSLMKVTTTSLMHGSRYRCIVSGTCTPSVTSNFGLLTVENPLSITAQPLNKLVCPNASTSFGVTVTGDLLTYQWQVNTGSGWSNLSNGGVYSDVTTNLLKLTNIPLGYHNNKYRCLVNGKCSLTTTSGEAELTLYEPAVITANPTASKTICDGDNSSFTIAATGSGLSYQWYTSNGTNYVPMTNTGFYSGVTTPTLTITGITTGTSTTTYSYFCFVTSTCNTVQANTVYLNVNARPAITSNPVNDTVCSNTDAFFQVAATGTDLTYQWQVSSVGANWTNLSNGGGYANVTTPIMKVTSTPAFDGFMYRCIVSGACTPSVTSTAGRLTVQSQLVIQTQPSDQTVCPNANAAFLVTAAGTNLVYQWQIFNSGWVNLTDAGIYSGTNTRTLTLTNVTAVNNNSRYRCLITGKCSIPVASTEGLLTVNVPPTITVNPATNTTICDGDNTSYTVGATGTSLTYQWYTHNGVSYVPVTNTGFYSGATTSTLNISGITAGASATTYSYFCVVSGACSNASTATLYLTVNVRPAITVPPSNVRICSGGNTLFTVTAAGTDLVYQWQVSTNGVHWTDLSNSGIYNNVTTPILMLTGATAMQDGYQYRCNVTGACTPAAPSAPATLTIDTAPVVTANPANKTICEGSTTSFAVTATGTSLTYQWQVLSGGWTDITNTGMYSGANTSTMTLSSVSSAVTGTRYRCIVSGSCAAPAISAEATLNVNTLPKITTNPTNTSVCPSGSTTLSIVATGSNLLYSWEVNTGSGWTALTNTGLYSMVNTPTLVITNALVSQNGYQFRCNVTGACTPAVVSSAATLTLNTFPTVTLNPVNTSVCLNGNTTLTAMGTGTGVGYQWQVSANGISWSPIGNSALYTGVTTNTLGITSAVSNINGYQYRCMIIGTCTPGAPTTAATLTVNQPTVITHNPANSTICETANTSFNVLATGSGLTYQWQENTGSGWANLINGGLYAGATSNTLSLTNVPATHNTYQYRCVVSGLCATSPNASNAATLTVNSNVVVNTQPSSPVICSGGSTSLTVAATGTGLSYQWYRYNGTLYVPVTNTGIHTGATTSSLVVTGLTSAVTTSFGYYCVVTGTCNQITTNTAYINVNALPVVTSSPTSVTTCDSSDFISFAVTGTGAGLTYQWQVNTGSSWTNLSNGTNVTGATTMNMKLVKAYFSMNGYQYRCIISGTCTPSVASSAATLTVTPLILPTVSIQANNTSICAGTAVNFTATPTTGGSSPVYQWKVNGTNVGTNSPTFTSSSLNDNDLVACVLTSSYSCPSRKIVTSNTIQMNVTANAIPTAVVSSSLGDTVCSGISDTFNVATTFAGAAAAYQWQLNGVDVGSNVNNYITDSLKDTDVVRCILTSNYACLATNNVSSNNLQVSVVQTTLASASIGLAADTSICRGVAVTLTASTVNAGTSPKYQWIKNGVDIAGQIFPTYVTSKINTDDSFAVRLTSSRQCVVPVQSKSLKFTVDRPVVVGIDIAVSFNGGNSYTFTAQPLNGGTNPVYEWDIDGFVVPNNSTAVFTSSTLKPSEKVRVRMTSNHPCVFNSRSVYSRGATTGIGGQESLITDLKLYPNPNTGKFTITGEYAGIGSETATITIVNTLGQLIHTADTKVVSGKLMQEVNLNGDPVSGMYIMRIQIGDKQEIRRFNITK